MTMIHIDIARLFAWTFLINILLPLSDASSQESLESLRKYPPSLLGKDTVDNAIASIKWQLKQQAAVQETYRRSRDDIAAKLEVTEANIDEINRSLPSAVRFLDDDGRSAMANLAMEQLLGARLELVSLKSLIQQMEVNLANDQDADHEVQKMEAEMQQRAAMSRLELAKYELDRNQTLQKQGTISDQAYRRSRMSLEVAEAEYAIAAKKAQMASRTVSVNVAKRLAEIRVEVEPVQAKIKSLEEFLDTLHKASELVSKIKQLKRQQELLQKDLALVGEALFDSTQKAVELRTFQSLVEDERKSSGDVDQ